MTNSSLIDCVISAADGNYSSSSSRTGMTDIVIHHMAGVLSAEQCGGVFANPGRGASAHYGVDGNGRVGLYVDEWDVAWHAGNWAVNQQSIGIEVANSSTGGDWRVSDAALNKTIKLVADIAKRNNLGRLVVGKNLTYHSMHSSTYCPGDYLRSKMQYIANEANKINYPEKKPVVIVWTDLEKPLRLVTTKDVTIVDLNDGGSAGTIKNNTVVDNLVQKTEIDGVLYYRTLWSKNNNKNNGLKAKYLKEIEEVAKVEDKEAVILEVEDGVTAPSSAPEVKVEDIDIPELTPEIEEEHTDQSGLTKEQIEELMKYGEVQMQNFEEIVEEVGKGFEFPKSVKMIAYLVGDLLIGAGVLTPSIVSTLNAPDLSTFATSLSSLLVSAGTIVLMTFKLLKKK